MEIHKFQHPQKWLTLAEPTYNWQLSMTVHVDINVP